MRGLVSVLVVLVGVSLTAGCRDGANTDDGVRRTAPRPTAAEDAGPRSTADDTAASRSNGGGGPPGSGGTIANPTTAPADCADPVTGVWTAKTYANSVGRWHEHRLTITRDHGQLKATQLTRMWDAGPDQTVAPVCDDGRAWGEVEMTDDVDWTEGVLHVWGTAIVRRAAWCGANADSYNLDSFTGRVRRSTYDAYNNDGHDAVDRPYRFRRIECIDP